MKTKNTIVVKIGGSTLGQHDTTLEDLVELQKRGQWVVVIHGGGKIISEWLTKMGASTRFVQGERVTDKPGLEVVTAVLSGVVNKDLAAAINYLGGKAVGISGVDGSLLQGRIKNPELGYVGNVENVNIDLLEALLNAGYIPVISSISYNSAIKPAEGPLLLNVNADIAAGEIAAALGAEKLVFLTDIAGICDKSGKVIEKLDTREAEDLITSGVATSGMIPKIRSGIRALDRARQSRIIDGRQPHALIKEIENSDGGTTILKKEK
jgi:acetylglutamate kinase